MGGPRELALTLAQFHALTDVTPEIDWFANITNPRTRVVYEVEATALGQFVGTRTTKECRQSHGRI